MALHWVTRISIVTLLALSASGCGRVELDTELPEAVLAGQNLEGEEADAAFASWVRGIGSAARMPVHLVYDLELIVEVEDEAAAGFAMEMAYALTLLDGARGRLELDASLVGDSGDFTLDFAGTIVFDGETAWAWGSADMEADAGGFAPPPQEGAFSFQQPVAEEFYASILDFWEDSEAFGGNFPRDRYPDPGSLLGLLHPATYLSISEPTLVCERLQLKGATLEATLGMDAGQMDAGEWKRAMAQLSATPQGAAMAPAMEGWMEQVFSERVPVRFDADTGVLREMHVDWQVPMPAISSPGFSGQDEEPATTDARILFSMRQRDFSHEAPSEGEVLARPEELEFADVTGLVQLGLQMALQGAAASAGAEDPAF